MQLAITYGVAKYILCLAQRQPSLYTLSFGLKFDIVVPGLALVYTYWSILARILLS